MMIKKGWQSVETPEKMPVITTGIEMSRREPSDKPQSPEKLTGGNQPADEALAAKLVVDDIRRASR
ncbi:MAG: hypothetical protein WCK47_07480 [bacterium]